MSGDVTPLFVSLRRAVVVLAIFCFIAPPVQFFIPTMATHPWIGGRGLLPEITQVIQTQFLPRMLVAYGFYMPICFGAGLWAAYGPAQGRALGIWGGVLRMAAVGITFELVVQGVLLLSGTSPTLSHIPMNLVQWVISGGVCGLVWLRIQKIPFLSAE